MSVGDRPRRRFLVTATPPTTNGDLHVGHLSGPYLAGDVFCRAQRQLGHEALYCCGGDDHQTYVVTTAERLGREPLELAAECNRRIPDTLRRADVALDAFAVPDAAQGAFVRRFFARLHDAGRLERRRCRFDFCAATGRPLAEAYVQGYCPTCLAPTSGAICEECGHPNDPDTLRFPSPVRPASGGLETRELEVLVLPLEHYRPQFEAYYARHGGRLRPRAAQFVEQMLSAPLPDFPITYPGDWGLPVGFDGLAGQVFNVWAEMLPALVATAEAAAGRSPAPDDTGDWDVASGCELVQFLGFDNTYYFAFAHLGIAFAHGRLLAPAAIVTNDLYQLEGQKFSTSRGHLIWARDLIERHGSDSVRFHLAFDNPELQPTSFSEQAFVVGVRRRLYEPLTAALVALTPLAGRRVEALPEQLALVRRLESRMEAAYALESFSLRDAAATVASWIGVLRHAAEGDAPGLAVIGMHRLASSIAPLLPSLGAALQEQLGPDDGSPLDSAAGVSVVTPSMAVDCLVGHLM